MLLYLAYHWYNGSLGICHTYELKIHSCRFSTYKPFRYLVLDIGNSHIEGITAHCRLDYKECASLKHCIALVFPGKRSLGLRNATKCLFSLCKLAHEARLSVF